MPDKRELFMRALKARNQQRTGRSVGANPTPGVPRRVGPRMHPQQLLDRRESPPYIQRDPLNDYQGHNLPVAPGEPDPNGGPPIIPGVEPTPRPRPRPAGTLGMRRLGMLGDKNQGNDKTGLEVLMRLFGRAQAGKNFGGKAFGERRGNNLDDFFAATDQYTKGTGYRRMLRQAAGLPVRPKTRNYPGKPRGQQAPPGPYIR